MTYRMMSPLLKIGAAVSCRIETVTDYGAWVSISGLDYPGLVLLPDLSWGRVYHPSDFVRVGSVYDMVVRRHDHAEQRINLSLKHVQVDPWILLKERLRPGERFEDTTVIFVADYGVFVELSQHIEALLHIDDMESCLPQFGHPRDIINVGERLDVVLSRVNFEERIAQVVLTNQNGTPSLDNVR